MSLLCKNVFIQSLKLKLVLTKIQQPGADTCFIALFVGPTFLPLNLPNLTSTFLLLSCNFKSQSKADLWPKHYTSLICGSLHSFNIISVIPFEFLLCYYFLLPVCCILLWICLNFSNWAFLVTVCVSVRVMENEEGRKEYLVFPPSKSQCPASSQKGRKIPLKGNGRRIDYILYSDEGLQQDWKLVWFSRGLQDN